MTNIFVYLTLVYPFLDMFVFYQNNVDFVLLFCLKTSFSPAIYLKKSVFCLDLAESNCKRHFCCGEP